MPFYLVHRAVMHLIKLAGLWIPFLNSFLGTLVISSLCTGVFSLMIVKSPGLIRYFFGLQFHDRALLSQWLKGYGPFIVLLSLRTIESIVANGIIRKSF